MLREYVFGDIFCELRMGTKRKLVVSNFNETEQKSNAVKVYIVLINMRRTMLICFDRFNKMGSIGVAEGEKITLAFEYAAQKKLAVVAVVASGGMRINEGTVALVQMAKMVDAVKKHSDKGLLYIAVVTNPTLGGASASFVSLADIIIAEKGAIYGFAGKRIIEHSTREQLPEDFQTSEYAMQHGMVDVVVDKKEIKSIIARLLFMHMK